VAELPALPKVDEFAFVLLAGVVMILILALAWSTPQEGSPLVDDTTFSLTMKPGDTQTFDFVVKGKTTLTAVNLTAAGEIASWIKFNKNNFDVREQATVVVTVKAPLNITNGLYTGRVTITGSGGKDTFSVNIDISDRTGNKTSKKPVNLGDFTVSYAKGTETLDSKSDVTVYGGYFSNSPIMLTGNIDNEKLNIATDANIELAIGSTNGMGNLIVLLNDDEVYNGAAGEGTMSIPIIKDILKNSSNTVLIKAAAPGLAFWSSTTYDIQWAKFEVSYDGAFPKNFTFTLSADQISNFKRFALFWVVGKNTVKPVPEMKIKINNQIVYWKVPPYESPFLDTTFKEDMFGSKLALNDGENTITFSFDENAFYSVTDATLTIEYYG